MRVEPPAGSGLAAASWPLVEIDGTENLQIALTDGYLLKGGISASDGTALNNALVTFYFTADQQIWDTWPMKSSSFSTTIRQAAQARTDSEGHFEVILPHPKRSAGAIGSSFTQWLTPEL